MNETTNTGRHEIELLENGEAYYARAFAAIRSAQDHVLLETFIWFWDEAGKQLMDALEAAAANGASVDITVDGWGTPDVPEECVSRLSASDIRLHVFDPTPVVFGMRPKFVGRMHRKLLVVDGDIAFVGGINIAEDHLVEKSADAKQDYAVAVRGPVVAEIGRYMRASIDSGRGYMRRPLWRRRSSKPVSWRDDAQASDVLFVTRDNAKHQRDIERYYLMSIRNAERDIVIANAYFFPSYRMLKHMRKAVARGVKVILILQGKPDMDYVRTAAATLYDYLLDADVEVYEYLERPLHAKVAVFDTEWSTVGSSNLDPLSFALNFEANVFVHSGEFAQELRDRLMRLVRASQRVTRDAVPRQRGWRHLVRIVVFHFLRRFPRWFGRFPNYRQHIEAGARPVSSSGLN